MSRIRTFALLATLVSALAVLASACGGGSSDPQSVVENATLQGVESGKLDAKVGISSNGAQGGNVEISLSGPFQSGGKGNLPELAMTAKAQGTVNGEAVDFDGALTLLSDRAFVGLKGKEYEVDPTTFGFIKTGFERASQSEGEEPAAEVAACQEAAAGLEPSQFVDNLESEGGTEVDGTSTTKVSGELDTGGAVDAVIKLVEDPACSAQLEAAGPLPLSELKTAKSELTSAIKSSHVELYVGDDDIIRKVLAEIAIQPQGSSERVEIELEVTLSEVNEEQEIKAPAEAQPLEGLFRELGVNPLELLEGGNGFGGLLESLMEGATGSGGGGGGGGSSPGGGLSSQQEYAECLVEAQTPTDLQKCASLLQ